MKRIVALLAVVMMLLSSASADELFRFADIDPALPYDQMKSTLEAKTGLRLSQEGDYIKSDANPAITFMQMPVTLLEATKDEHASYIVVNLELYEIDAYDDYVPVAFDEGRYDMIREKADARFGEPRCIIVSFNDGTKDYYYRVDDQEELRTLVNDAAIMIFKSGYKIGSVQIIRKNTTEIYQLMDMTDPATYGNVSIVAVYPGIMYCSRDLESAIRKIKLLDEYPVFPMLNGVFQFAGDY